MSDLWERLKQRKLVQWAIAYVAAAFALLQGVDIVAQRFGWPEAIERVLIIACFVGFFVTLLLAWYHGERGAQKVSGTELLLLGLVLAVGGGLLWRYAPAVPASGSAAAAAASDDRHSIAVLPFVNMSGDRDNEYFSDGISEEILNVLARTPDLHVAARTSSFAFKGKALEIPVIARELGVRMVLEGSVRKQGDRVRITAQLIDARTGFHVLSQTYDRQLKDIFAIQDEIARAIGDELEVKLAGTPAPGKNSVGTTNLKAYDLYLRGMSLWQMREEANVWQAIDQFEQAVAADPGFAQAYGGLALAYAVIPDYSSKISYAEAFAKMSDAAEMALVLDPSQPEAYTALASQAVFELRRKTDIALLHRAIALRPSFATAYQWLGTDLLGAGQPTAGLAALEQASRLDPHSKIVANNLAVVLMALGRYDDSRAACERALRIDPNYSDCLLIQAIGQLQAGDLPAARGLLLRAATLRDPGAQALVSAICDAIAGQGDSKAAAHALLAYATRDAASGRGQAMFGTMQAPTLLMFLHEPDLALAYLEANVAHPEAANAPTEWALFMAAFDPLRCSPRFQALVRQRRTTDPRAAAVCVAKS